MPVGGLGADTCPGFATNLFLIAGFGCPETAGFGDSGSVLLGNNSTNAPTYEVKDDFDKEAWQADMTGAKKSMKVTGADEILGIITAQGGEDREKGSSQKGKVSAVFAHSGINHDDVSPSACYCLASSS